MSESIEPSSDIEIFLNGNPVECDCKVYEFLQYINKDSTKSLNNKFKFYIENLVCKGPSEFSGKTLRDLKLTSFTCNSETMKFTAGDPCSNNGNCTCQFRPFDKFLIVDCSARNLREIPDFPNLKGIDKVELNLQSNNLKQMPDMKKLGYNKIEVIDLSNNQISEVPENILRSTSLKVINRRIC